MLREKRRELETLRLAAGQRLGRLAEAEVAEADRAERGELPEDGALVDEEAHRLVDGHLEDVVHVLLVIRHLHDLLVEASAAALLADDLHVREKLHVDADRAGALALLATAASGVEREHSGSDAIQLRAGRLGEQLADL